LAPLLNGIAIPLLLLSGILLPMSIAPAWLEDLSDANPIKHVVDGVRSFFLGDIASSASIWGLFWAVTLVAVGLAFGARTFRREPACARSARGRPRDQDKDGHVVRTRTEALDRLDHPAGDHVGKVGQPGTPRGRRLGEHTGKSLLAELLTATVCLD